MSVCDCTHDVVFRRGQCECDSKQRRLTKIILNDQTFVFCHLLIEIKDERTQITNGCQVVRSTTGSCCCDISHYYYVSVELPMWSTIFPQANMSERTRTYVLTQGSPTACPGTDAGPRDIWDRAAERQTCEL